VSQNLSIHLQRELRSDHAGETGAVYLYKGIVAVAQWRGDEEMFLFAKAHGATEADHLKQVEHWLPTSQRSLLLGPWRLAGWLTGALPALFGRRAVYGTVAAVETFVDQHYQQQIEHLQEFGGPEGLLPLLIRCQADEQNHRDESSALAGDKSHFLLRAWCRTVGWGSAAAVLLARRL
jgi:ubiquinone biosynthesis monooxygenase Coq7